MIPCYNEEATIGSVVLKAKQYVDEVVVVDGGSNDDAVKVAEYAGAKVLKYGGNKGHSTSIQSCFRYALENDFDVLTIFNGDGQYNADNIPTVMNPVLEKKADVSIASLSKNNNSNSLSFLRKYGRGILTRLTKADSKEKHKTSDSLNGFTAYSRKAIEKLQSRSP